MAETALVVSDLPMTAGLVDGESAIKVQTLDGFGPALQRLIADAPLRHWYGRSGIPRTNGHRTMYGGLVCLPPVETSPRHPGPVRLVYPGTDVSQNAGL